MLRCCCSSCTLHSRAALWLAGLPHNLLLLLLLLLSRVNGRRHWLLRLLGLGLLRLRLLRQGLRLLRLLLQAGVGSRGGADALVERVQRNVDVGRLLRHDLLQDRQRDERRAQGVQRPLPCSTEAQVLLCCLLCSHSRPLHVPDKRRTLLQLSPGI